MNIPNPAQLAQLAQLSQLLMSGGMAPPNHVMLANLRANALQQEAQRLAVNRLNMAGIPHAPHVPPPQFPHMQGRLPDQVPTSLQQPPLAVPQSMRPDGIDYQNRR